MKTKKKLFVALVVMLLCMGVLLSIRFLSGDEDIGNKQIPSKPINHVLSYYKVLSGTTFNMMRVFADRENSGYLPKAYTCEGVGDFPTLTIKEIPLSAEALAIIVEDPDAPGGTRDHLLIANVPIVAQTMIISEHDLSKGLSGQNSWGDLGRGAPCPPSGVHRYIFKVYAVKHLLELSSGFTKEGLLEKMQGNVVAEAEIIGLYQKSL